MVYLHVLVLLKLLLATDTLKITIFSLQNNGLAAFKFLSGINARNLLSCANSFMRFFICVRAITFITIFRWSVVTGSM